MTNEKVKKIHVIYGLITAFLILLVAIGLIVSCVAIYQSGDRPFSRQVIILALVRLAIPGWLCLISVIGGIALHVIAPMEKEKVAAIHLDAELLLRYQAANDQLSQEIRDSINTEQKKVMRIKVLSAALIVLLFVYPVMYFSDAQHFGVSNINADIVKAVLIVMLPAIFSGLCLYVRNRFIEKSIRRQIKLYKDSGIKPVKANIVKPSNEKNIRVSYFLMAAAIILIVLGIGNDGVSDVLGKAIRICTECIGLG